jgi:hypothetical protein
LFGLDAVVPIVVAEDGKPADEQADDGGEQRSLLRLDVPAIRAWLGWIVARMAAFWARILPQATYRARLLQLRFASHGPPFRLFR